MKYNLIIPSVGTGKRYENAGYLIFKPLIEIFGKKMIEYVTDSFPIEINVIIIAADSKKKLLSNITFPKNYYLLYIEDHKNGPAYSIQKALPILNSDEAFFVAYNDIVWDWDFELLMDYITVNNPDGLVFTHQGFHPHLYNNNFSAFCKTEGNEIIEIREKSSFTNDWMNENLSVGVFYFKNKKILKDSINSVINNKQRVASEYYPSLAFNYLISSGLRVIKYDVSNFVHWGVPEQLEDVLHWERVFNNENLKHEIKICMMMCGTGERMKVVSEVNKAGITIQGDKMCNYVFKKFNSKNNCLIVNDDTLSLAEGEAEIINIHVHTKSQTETLLQAFSFVLNTKNIIFTSNDCFGFIDSHKLLELLDSDLVLFGFKASLLQQKQDSSHTYFETDGDLVSEILIKTKSKTGFGLAGLFYVPDGKIFQYLSDLDLQINHSFDHFAKYLLSIGKRIKFIIIEDYVHLGTPEEYKEFLFWEKKHEKN
ncbi:MAG: hypothetical protein PHP52_00715 [Bacteroidales bacterium]|nr:hypothetical protein [Bacteroidales bacterium]MDD4217909.1 hypothetical protein [Bacteroidales bacterium]MDY0140882.1 hypothetical protein [Bacteroidales bacterium]